MTGYQEMEPMPLSCEKGIDFCSCRYGTLSPRAHDGKCGGGTTEALLAEAVKAAKEAEKAAKKKEE